jgi:hypothetical protein
MCMYMCIYVYIYVLHIFTPYTTHTHTYNAALSLGALLATTASSASSATSAQGQRGQRQVFPRTYPTSSSLMQMLQPVSVPVPLSVPAAGSGSVSMPLPLPLPRPLPLPLPLSIPTVISTGGSRLSDPAYLNSMRDGFMHPEEGCILDSPEGLAVAGRCHMPICHMPLS